jgi:hypothetical protein
MITSRLRRLRPDDGYSMILVLGIGLVLTAVAILAAGRGMAAVQGSSTHAVFGQNLDVAEAGIDQISSRVQATNGSYVYCPSPPTIAGTDADPCKLPANVRLRGFTTRDAERQWAATTLRTLAAQDPSPLVSTRGGQYLAIKPAGLNTVYSMSWVPSYDAVVHPKPGQSPRQRLLKSEYVFSTYRTSAALLTNGDVSCCASYDFGITKEMAPTSTIPIHTNGTLTGSVSATSGVLQATAAGGCSSPCVGGQQKISVPAIDPRAFYNGQAWRYADNWYDLCSDGVRRPNLAPNATPCTGTLITSIVSTSQPFQGWSRNGNTWSNSGGYYPGVYYVYRGNVDQGSAQGSNIATWSAPMTVITEPTVPRTTCPKTDGYQSYKAVDWLSGGFIPGVMVVSGWYWYQDSNSHLASGAVLAQGYVEQHTSSSAGLSGQIIAENICGGTNKLQGSVLAYNGGSDLPLNQVFRNTLELELN